MSQCPYSLALYVTDDQSSYKMSREVANGKRLIYLKFFQIIEMSYIFHIHCYHLIFKIYQNEFLVKKKLILYSLPKSSWGYRDIVMLAIFDISQIIYTFEVISY